MNHAPLENALSRRRILGYLAGLGIMSPTLSRALAVEIERSPLTAESIGQAEWISGVTLSDEQRSSLVRSVERMQSQLEQIRAVPLDSDVAPALRFSNWSDAYDDHFQPSHYESQRVVRASDVAVSNLPVNEVDIAYAPLAVLAAMLREREISSLELTQLFLERLERWGPRLNCVVSLTPELAIRQAKRADREFAAGRDAGPLQGIPWGAKDLIAVKGYPTTWGADAFREQTREEDATVVRRLESMGAVLVAKLTLGAYAMGDEWFGGRTLNPWNLEQGSSGSSAGSAAATAAGLVPFALGSETLGSIVSPSTRCGATGLRPTFGRVSRAGCMPLAWSFDKLGPIARCVEDCAIVFAAIHGADGLDATAVSRPFHWPYTKDWKALRVGYTGEPMNRPELEVLRSLGLTLVPITLPSELPVGALTMMIDVESASMFYDQWKNGNEEGLYRWSRTWQSAAFIPAIDYVRAARVRSLLMKQMEEAIAGVDLYVGGNDLVLTNLTGHPSVVMPYRENAESKSGQPAAITFTGHLHGEAALLAISQAFQQATQDHIPRPPEFS
jgi:Asp-tRNA(Asn)/Glu-tRNA(Gln) amidotransferase A subunit family amidase